MVYSVNGKLRVLLTETEAHASEIVETPTRPKRLWEIRKAA